MFKGAVKIWFWIIVVVLFISVGGFVAKIVLFPAHVANKVIDTATGVVDQTLNANNALFNYENFKDLYNGAKAQVMNIANTKNAMDNMKVEYGEPKTWSKDVRSQNDFLRQNLDGYLMQYQSIVKQYNSDSSKLNRNLFKDRNLPSEFNEKHCYLKVNCDILHK